MNQDPLIAIMIHDLNPWGGQDRSMLEIAKQLNKNYALEIHSFTLEGENEWKDMNHIPYDNLIKKPMIVKYMNYHLNSWKKLKKSQSSWVQSTGLASLKSDVVQVQFIHHTWEKIKNRIERDETSSLLRNCYHKVLSLYNLLLEQQIYTPEKKYIAISHSIKKELMEHFQIPSENIEIIYHGVDPEHFYPYQDKKEAKLKRQEVRAQLGIQENDFVLLHVGALNARKGLYKSLQVLSSFKKNGINNVKLLAVGQGDQKSLKKWSEKLEISNDLILAPHSKDIRDYYWAADTFFFPSFYEPFGLVILEAMSCGLPTVTSSLAGGSELIVDNENGLLFDPNDRPKNIANTLLTVIRDPNKAKLLAEKARETAVEHSWINVGKQYNKFYGGLIQEKKTNTSESI